MIKMKDGEEMPKGLVTNYFQYLVDCFYKILPMRESGEKSVTVYIASLRREIIGCKKVIDAIDNDAKYVCLINTLQYFLEEPECDLSIVRREVFKCINICTKMGQRYAER